MRVKTPTIAVTIT